jgi:hypothetical protein
MPGHSSYLLQLICVGRVHAAVSGACVHRISFCSCVEILKMGDGKWKWVGSQDEKANQKSRLQSGGFAALGPRRYSCSQEPLGFSQAENKSTVGVAAEHEMEEKGQVVFWQHKTKQNKQSQNQIPILQRV